MDTNRPKYRPLFLEHFEKKDVNHLNLGGASGDVNGELADHLNNRCGTCIHLGLEMSLKLGWKALAVEFY